MSGFSTPEYKLGTRGLQLLRSMRKLKSAVSKWKKKKKVTDIIKIFFLVLSHNNAGRKIQLVLQTFKAPKNPTVYKHSSVFVNRSKPFL